MRSSTGFSEIIDSDDLSEPRQGPPAVIAVTSLIGVVEGFLLVLVVRSSWSSYVKAHRRQYSFCGFLRKLSFIKKVRRLRMMYVIYLEVWLDNDLYSQDRRIAHNLD